MNESNYAGVASSISCVEKIDITVEQQKSVFLNKWYILKYHFSFGTLIK